MYIYYTTLICSTRCFFPGDEHPYPDNEHDGRLSDNWGIVVVVILAAMVVIFTVTAGILCIRNRRQKDPVFSSAAVTSKTEVDETTWNYLVSSIPQIQTNAPPCLSLSLHTVRWNIYHKHGSCSIFIKLTVCPFIYIYTIYIHKRYARSFLHTLYIVLTIIINTIMWYDISSLLIGLSVNAWQRSKLLDGCNGYGIWISVF